MNRFSAFRRDFSNEISLFFGSLSLGEFFSENLLFENEHERFAKEANLAHSRKFRASRVLKFWALSEILGGNSQNGVNFGENLGANSNSANFGDEFGANSNLNLAKFKGDFAKNLALSKMRDDLEKKWRKTRLHLCLSHSGTLVALAAAPFKIGFDIERIKPRNTAAVMDFCFNPHEKTRVLNAKNAVKIGKFADLNLAENMNLNENANLNKNANLSKNTSANAVNLGEFYRIFTAKEALLKLCDLTFADFDKVGFTADNKIHLSHSTHSNLNDKNIQAKHYKFNFQGQEFIACYAF